MPDKPKRKRKRKNKNKNKLSADQMPVFGPEIVPTEADMKEINRDAAQGNNHVRFDYKHEESDNMEVVDEDFTAEEIKQLYNQSVSSAATTGSSISQEQSGNRTNNGQDTSSNNGQNTKLIKDVKPKKYQVFQRKISNILCMQWKLIQVVRMLS
eukprot:TRINITY_DN9111_c0_g1_i1.p1 TRINITY_DN9111_c0_g1~~TRINITY_DN9111_c0_g1_i1.p1  ORF type:complete len:154 (+),score=45.60 TRINITY_DN9111_c0_g1_i1:337-798(+)